MQVALLLAACLGAANAAVGVLKVDLVFPRNETYAPMALFPVIIAFQNTELAPFLNTQLSLEITNWDDGQQTGAITMYDMRWANFSSNDPYYELRVFSDFNKEGRWRLTWQVSWDSCTEDSLSIFAGDNFITNRTGRSMMFTTNKSAQEVDLVAATTNRSCSEDEGVAINVASTLTVPERVSWDGGGMCASMASTTPSPTPCRVKFDSAAAASMSSSMTALHCKATQVPGSSCSSEGDDKSAAHWLAGGAAAGLLAAAVGALVI